MKENYLPYKYNRMLSVWSKLYNILAYHHVNKFGCFPFSKNLKLRTVKRYEWFDFNGNLKLKK